jgi:hypothetical protein
MKPVQNIEQSKIKKIEQMELSFPDGSILSFTKGPGKNDATITLVDSEGIEKKFDLNREGVHAISLFYCVF